MGTVERRISAAGGTSALGRCTLRRPATRRNRRSVADPPGRSPSARPRAHQSSVHPPWAIPGRRSRGNRRGARGALLGQRLRQWKPMRPRARAAIADQHRRAGLRPVSEARTNGRRCAGHRRSEPRAYRQAGRRRSGHGKYSWPRGQEPIRRAESQYRDRDHGQRLEGDLDHRSAASAGHMSRVQSARGAASPHPRPSTDGAAGHGSARPSRAPTIPRRRRADARRLCRGNAHAERTYDRLGSARSPRRLDARSTISRSHEGRMAPQGDPSMSLRPRLARALQPCLCWLPAASRRHRRARQGHRPDHRPRLSRRER